jgi:pantoate--beta-alanine ligase
MDVIRAAAQMRAVTDARRAAADTTSRVAEIGLVPTMGALHAGHASLLARARENHRFVVMSLFVNPAQFGAGEDFDRYPRDEERDMAIAERHGVDAVFAPTVDEMYPPGVALVEPSPGPVGETLEGAARPGHFGGVLKVVHRLLEIAGPATAYFGEKDAQQLFLVRLMAAELGLPVQVTACPIVRAPDGLALSSRNVRLTPEEREAAGCLFLALSEAAELARHGERDAAVLVAAMAREIGATPLATLDYAAVVDDRTFEHVRTVDGPARALVAARFGSTRLIDNLPVAAD